MEEEVSVRIESSRYAKGSPINDYIAGAFGGMVGLVVGHPFDTTKVQMQTQSKGKKYRGTIDALQHIRTQGISTGFFRGMSWPMMSYGIVNAVFFGVYGHAMKALQQHDNTTGEPTFGQVYAAGCIAGAAQLVVACPVELIKVILQSQIPRIGGGLHKTNTEYYKGPWEALTAVVRKRGVTGCYRGLVAMTYRDVPSYGLYCLTYESISDSMHRRGLTDKRGIIASLVAGGFAGTITWFSIIPLDLIKNRMQADLNGKYRNMWHCGIKTYKEEGLRSLYRGTLITCVRAFIVNAITFLVYSQSLKYLLCYNDSLCPPK